MTSPPRSVPKFLGFANSLISTLIRSGVPVGPNVLLTVPGRKSGTPRTTPIAILSFDDQRYIQSPYGNVDWVRNLRAAGEGTIRKGRNEEQVRAVEVSGEEAAPVYRNLMPTLPSVLRKYFDIENDASLAEYAEMSKQHPMFRLIPV